MPCDERCPGTPTNGARAFRTRGPHPGVSRGFCRSGKLLDGTPPLEGTEGEQLRQGAHAGRVRLEETGAGASHCKRRASTRPALSSLRGPATGAARRALVIGRPYGRCGRRGRRAVGGLASRAQRGAAICQGTAHARWTGRPCCRSAPAANPVVATEAPEPRTLPATARIRGLAHCWRKPFAFHGLNASQAELTCAPCQPCGALRPRFYIPLLH